MHKACASLLSLILQGNALHLLFRAETVQDGAGKPGSGFSVPLSGESYPLGGGYNNGFRMVFSNHRPLSACQLAGCLNYSAGGRFPLTDAMKFLVDGKIYLPEFLRRRKNLPLKSFDNERISPLNCRDVAVISRRRENLSLPEIARGRANHLTDKV